MHRNCLILLSVVIIFCGCQNISSGNNTKISLPYLEYAIVDIQGPYNEKEQRYGSISFTGPIIWPFGYEAKGPGYPEPCIHYWTAYKTPIYAVCSGIVVNLFKNDSYDDYEMLVKIDQNSEWWIGYDHFIEPVFKLNDKINKGQIIGFVANNSKIELTVGNNGMVYPPYEYFSPEIKILHDSLADEIKTRKNPNFNWAVRGAFDASN